MTDIRNKRQSDATNRAGAEAELPPMWATAETVARVIEPPARAMACANLEMSSLVGHRMRAYASIPETLRKCRSPLDVVQAQMAFWQEAGNHYKAATEHILSAWSSILLQSQGAEPKATGQRDVLFVSESDAASQGDRRRPGDDRRAA